MSSRLFVKSRGLPLIVLASLGFSHAALAGFEWYPPAAEEPAQSQTMQAYPTAAPSNSYSGNAPVIISGQSPQPSPQPSYEPISRQPESITPVIVTGTAPVTKPILQAPASSSTSTMQQAPVSTANQSSVTTVTSTPSASDEIPIYTGPAPDLGPSHPSSLPAPQTVSNHPTSLAPVIDSSPPLPTASAATSSTSNDVVHGFARNVPVVVAMRQILPAGYTFSIDQNVDMGTLVSFQGGRPWRDTLHDMLLPVGLKMNEQGQMVQIGYAGDNNVASVTGTQASTYQPGQQPRPLAANDGPVTVSPSPAASTPVITGPGDTAPAPEAVVETWTADRGSSLHKILTDWCLRAHTELNWLAEYDYPLEASVNFTGTFPEAVRSLLTGFEGAHPQPVAELHSNSSIGQMVLVVQARGNTNTD